MVVHNRSVEKTITKTRKMENTKKNKEVPCVAAYALRKRVIDFAVIWIRAIVRFMKGNCPRIPHPLAVGQFIVASDPACSRLDKPIGVGPLRESAEGRAFHTLTSGLLLLFP